MKKLFSILSSVMILTSALFVATSCEPKDEIQNYYLGVSVTLPGDLALEDVQDFKVIVNSNKTSAVELDFKDLSQPITKKFIAGTYDVVVSGQVSETQFLVAKETVELYANKDVEVKAELQTKSAFVFKTIYSTTSNGFYAFDGFVEIVNNSNEVQYLDQLIVSFNGATDQTGPNAWQSNGKAHLYASGQSIVVAFPGEGEDYPVEPGESVVIANRAARHEIKAMESETNITLDLSDADFEVFFAETPSGDIDNPNVPNMDVIWVGTGLGKDYFMGVLGTSLSLSRPSNGQTAKAYGQNPEYVMTEPGSASDMTYLVVESKDVLDAVHLVSADNTTPHSYYLPIDDAEPGIISGRMMANCSVRKSEVINGKTVYIDTNNSKNDWLNEQELPFTTAN